MCLSAVMLRLTKGNAGGNEAAALCSDPADCGAPEGLSQEPIMFGTNTSMAANRPAQSNRERQNTRIWWISGQFLPRNPLLSALEHPGAAQLQDSGLPDPEPRGGAPSLGDCTQDPQQGDAPAGECPVSSEKGSGSYAELPTSASRGPSSTASWPPFCTIAAAFVAPSSSFVSESCKGWVRMRLSPVNAAPETVKASSDEEDRGSLVPAAEAPRVLAIALCHLICC